MSNNLNIDEKYIRDMQSIAWQKVIDRSRIWYEMRQYGIVVMSNRRTHRETIGSQDHLAKTQSFLNMLLENIEQACIEDARLGALLGASFLEEFKKPKEGHSNESKT